MNAPRSHTTHLPAPVMPRVPPQKLLLGQKALVTGASSGIGRAIALALGEAGADVVVNYVVRRGQGARARRTRSRRTASRAIAHPRRRVATRRRCRRCSRSMIERVRHDRHPGQQRRPAAGRAVPRDDARAVEHGDRREPHRPVPVRARGGARVQAPRRAAGGVLRGRQDHLHQLGARGDPLGGARELRRVEGRRDADDEEHRAGSGAVPHPRELASAPARSARRSTWKPGTRPRPTTS